MAGFLQAAAELFAAVGYEATTIQTIADRSDSSIGALYNYFPDKESVAATLRQQYSEDLQSRVKSLMVESNSVAGCTTEWASSLRWNLPFIRIGKETALFIGLKNP